MPFQRWAAVIMLLLVVFLIAPGSLPPLRAQGVDVFLNVTGGGTRKLNIAVPEFTVVSGTDSQGVGKRLHVANVDDDLDEFHAKILRGVSSVTTLYGTWSREVPAERREPSDCCESGRSS